MGPKVAAHVGNKNTYRIGFSVPEPFTIDGHTHQKQHFQFSISTGRKRFRFLTRAQNISRCQTSVANKKNPLKKNVSKVAFHNNIMSKVPLLFTCNYDRLYPVTTIDYIILPLTFSQKTVVRHAQVATRTGNTLRYKYYCGYIAVYPHLGRALKSQSASVA